MTFLHLAKVKLGVEPPRPPPPPPPKLEEDAAFKEIVKTRESARAFLDGATSPTGDLTPDVAVELEKRIDLLAKNSEELAGLSAKYSGTGSEVTAHAKLQTELASALGTIKVALEKIAAANAAAAAKAAQPVAVEYDLQKINPWAGRAPKTWVRTRTTAGRTVLHEDGPRVDRTGARSSR